MIRTEDKAFLADKECLICLEAFDIEKGEVVKLPCNCANPVYHKTCILRFLSTGENKNFCPHCKQVYSQEQQEQPPQQQEQPNHEQRIRAKLSFIILVHVLTNSIMNIINLGMSTDESYNNKIANITTTILVISYFCKLVMNTYIVFHARADALCASYAAQTMIFVLIICLLSNIKFNVRSVMMLFNNIIFFFGDFAFRLSIEYQTT